MCQFTAPTRLTAEPIHDKKFNGVLWSNSLQRCMMGETGLEKSARSGSEQWVCQNCSGEIGRERWRSRDCWGEKLKVTRWWTALVLNREVCHSLATHKHVQLNVCVSRDTVWAAMKIHNYITHLFQSIKAGILYSISEYIPFHQHKLSPHKNN